MQIQHDAYSTDIVFYTSGAEECASGHGFGPAIRDHYLIHFITKGRGIYKVGHKRYTLKAGQAFLICPNVITYYQADMEKPWAYTWIGFTGNKAGVYLKQGGLDEDHLVFFYNQESIIPYIEQVNRCNPLSPGRDCKLLGLLYHMLGNLIEDLSLQGEEQSFYNDYVKEAKRFVGANYSRDITVNDIATYLSINRSYLYALFMEQLGQSPKAYITSYKLEKARELMKSSGLNIGQIARSVGYRDR